MGTFRLRFRAHALFMRPNKPVFNVVAEPSLVTAYGNSQSLGVTCHFNATFIIRSRQGRINCQV